MIWLIVAISKALVVLLLFIGMYRAENDRRFIMMLVVAICSSAASALAFAEWWFTR